MQGRREREVAGESEECYPKVRLGYMAQGIWTSYS